jgi:hypothetical protein
MKLKSLLLVTVLMVMFVCAGCQSQPSATTTTTEQPAQNLPYSKGPQGPPMVKGPTAPPPEVSDSGTQAVTEKENVKYALQ